MLNQQKPNCGISLDALKSAKLGSLADSQAVHCQDGRDCMSVTVS